jgi:hypothetical protein
MVEYEGEAVVPLLLGMARPAVRAGVAYRYDESGDVNVTDSTGDSPPVPVVATEATAMLLKTQQVQEGEDAVPIRR